MIGPARAQRDRGGQGGGEGPARRFLKGALVLAAVIAVVGVMGVVSRAFPYSGTLESGRQQLQAMKDDPVIAFRAPGTTLRSKKDHAASIDAFRAETSSSVRRAFEMKGEPGDAVVAYRQAAEGSGWSFVIDGCSRGTRATGAVFGKSIAGFDVTLAVRAQLDRARPPEWKPDESRGLYETQKRDLIVTMVTGSATASSLPVPTGFERNDVHCLRNLDLSDPDVQPPRASRQAVRELCSRFPLAAAQAIVPEIHHPELEPAYEECWVEDSVGFPILIVHAAGPRALYVDSRVAARQATNEIFLFSVDGRTDDPGRVESWYVGTPGGPYVVGFGGGWSRRIDLDDALFRLARLFAETTRL
jgi:hypothetical protein